MSSTSPTDGELTTSSPPAARPEPTSEAAGGQSARPILPDVTSELTDQAALDSTPPRRSDSFIPLPEGFRQRPSGGAGIDFALGIGARPPKEPPVGPALQAADDPRAESGTTRPSEGARDVEPAPASQRTDASLPRLLLVGIEAPELIYERVHEPSEQSPILYRERAYLVDSLQSDADLEEQLETELATIQDGWRSRDASQFVQLSLFDQPFEGEPTLPPIATLTWKDWQGRTEIWVRGVRRSSLPPSTPLDENTPLDRARLRLDEPDDDELEPIPLVARHARSSEAPSADVGAEEATELESPLPDSGPAWQSPDKSGEYLIPIVEEGPTVPPSSQRVLASDELIGALFERMHELRYLPDVPAGADYVLEIIEEHIACDGALIQVFDIATREFVVVRALGPRNREVLLARSPGIGSHLEDALRRQTTLELGPDGPLSSRLLWQRLGLKPDHALCAPVHEHGRYLGAIEVARDAGQSAFSALQITALEYICEQFADFVADRPIDLTPDSLLPPHL